MLLAVNLDVDLTRLDVIKDKASLFIGLLFKLKRSETHEYTA